ncbi:MAG: hypothetical protein QOD86_1269, partial [Miltoncostaeaceae bacterium]|nr:hypothetical protein [Miltoncostaeaceae bacterium]
RQRVAARRGRLRARAAQSLAPDNSLQPPHVGGAWSEAKPLPIVAINATLMRTGKVLIFAYPWRPGRPDPDHPGETLADPGYANAYVFDPVSGVSTQVDPPVNPETGKPAYIFCAGTSLLPDGRVLVVGGDVGDPTAQPNQGLNTVYTFDPEGERWQTYERTRQGRWYPSQLEMADGRTLIVAGMPRDGDPDWPQAANADVEIFSPDGSMQLLRNFRTDGQGHNPPLIGQYPHLFWMPGGHALVAGPRMTDTWRFLAPTPGADDAGSEDMPDLPEFREWASGVLLPGSAQVMLFGGADKDDRYNGPAKRFPAMASTVRFDDANPTLGWQPGPAMRVARAFSNSVQLPDGRVAVVGGGSGEDPFNEHYRWLYTEAHKRVDLYDPAADRFILGNAQAEARTYHSSALLLPDARVMSAGDDINGPAGPDSGVKTDTAEFWSPPYLFEADGSPAARPALDAAPAAIDYGKAFTASTSSTDVARAVLVAPGASTHDTDMSQRVVPLAPPQGVAGGVNLVAPDSADLAPPGYYMLFLLDADGTPSTARFVLLRDEPDPQPTPSPSPSPTATPAPFTLRVKAARPRLRRLRRTRRLPVTVTPNRAGAVRLTLGFAGRRLARTRMSFAGGFGRVGSLRLSRAGARRLAGRRRATLVLRASGAPASGAPVKVVRRLRLKR